MKYFSLLIAMLILVGVGCQAAPTIPEATAPVVPLDSPFRGVDGSLSKNAFDRAADGFMTWAGARELNPETIDALVAVWREATGETYPATDSFQEPIIFRLPTWPERVLQLRSAGQDARLDTEDDFVRHYPFREQE